MSSYPAKRANLLKDVARARHCADVLKAVAHPVRLRIIATLCKGPLHVDALAEALEEKQAIISQQLRILRLRGLVSVERRGALSVYELAEPALWNLVGCMESCTIR
jgi:DNA-binding transcriptional ArsR family regulator